MIAAPPQIHTRQLPLNHFTFSLDSVSTAHEPPFVEVIAPEWEWVQYQGIGASIDKAIPYREWGLQIPTGEV